MGDTNAITRRKFHWVVVVETKVGVLHDVLALLYVVRERNSERASCSNGSNFFLAWLLKIAVCVA